MTKPEPQQPTRDAHFMNAVAAGLLSLAVLVAGVFYVDPFSLSKEVVQEEPEVAPGPAAEAEQKAAEPANESTASKTNVVIPFTPEPVKDPVKQQGMLKLPNGTYVEPLNGVINPPEPSWEKNRPYSPIVGKERSFWPGIGQLEMYLHADGSRTTTMMTDMDRNGQISREAITIVNHPPPPGHKPVLLGEQDPDPARRPTRGQSKSERKPGDR